MNRRLTAIIQREAKRYVALCPEVDVASQGDDIAEARQNLEEAVELFFEVASPGEIDHRMRGEAYVTQIDVAVETGCTGRGTSRDSERPRGHFDGPETAGG